MDKTKFFFIYFFYTQQSYVLYTSLFLRQNKKREKIHTINRKKTKQNKTKQKNGRMTQSNAFQKH